jgi:hypothetical protein
VRHHARVDRVDALLRKEPQHLLDEQRIPLGSLENAVAHAFGDVERTPAHEVDCVFSIEASE